MSVIQDRLNFLRQRQLKGRRDNLSRPPVKGRNDRFLSLDQLKAKEIQELGMKVNLNPQNLSQLQPKETIDANTMEQIFDRALQKLNQNQPQQNDSQQQQTVERQQERKKVKRDRELVRQEIAERRQRIAELEGRRRVGQQLVTPQKSEGKPRSDEALESIARRRLSSNKQTRELAESIPLTPQDRQRVEQLIGEKATPETEKKRRRQRRNADDIAQEEAFKWLRQTFRENPLGRPRKDKSAGSRSRN